MYEALKNTDCEQILFMDDDIRIEPDSILRALALNRFAKAPTLIGGQMLNLQEPSHLHVMGEVVDRSNFMWTNAPFTEYDHDFAKYPLNDDSEKSALLHRRIDVDYNGWWMCMIPRRVAEELGQPLPLFIKWDDADYGLRAGEHGLHGHHAGHRDLAHGLERQGRRHRLAGLLPPAQPPGGLGPALGRPIAGCRQLVEGDHQTPDVP
jgi:GT2 family glycosyltransferase